MTTFVWTNTTDETLLAEILQLPFAPLDCYC